MFGKAFLSLASLLLSGFIFITPSLAARDKNGHWIPLPPVETIVIHSIVASQAAPPGRQDVNRSLTYIIDDCEQAGNRLMPYNFEELYSWFSVVEKVEKTSVAMPVEPTTYTWTFSGMNSYLEVIPTVYPCGHKPTTSIVGKSVRGISVDTIPTYPTTSAEAIQITITEAVMVTVTVQVTAAQSPQHDAYSLGKIKAPETMDFCPTNITITHTKPLITTVYSSMDYTIVTEDTRSDRPTSPYTFWDSMLTTAPTESAATETNTSSASSKFSGKRNVFSLSRGLSWALW
ncbi:hypothetical protein BGX38DRAFT_1139367 [Terfezia claveryi]|nr:hypothetical protein BGX38DRAFT_1139367 [Terfezia claveryi]